jgi:hypothetical protein
MLIHLQEIVDDRLCYEKLRNCGGRKGYAVPTAGVVFIAVMVTITPVSTGTVTVAKAVRSTTMT